MLIHHTEGLLSAPFTPFHQDGSLNLDLIPGLVETLIADGVSGAFVCGSNGEGPNLTTAERKKLTEAFVRASAGRLRILVHVGHASIRESQDLMRHARDCGADAASAVAAFYFKPTSVQNLVACMSEIASAAPDFPFYYYHIPTLTGVGMDMTEFLRLGETAIPNLQGIKYTATTLWEYQACLNVAQGRFDVLYGFDEMLLPALSVGARAAIGSTYNFAAPMYLDVIAAYRAGKLEQAQEIMNELVNMVRVLVKFPPIPAQKAIMHMLGWDLGPCRLPLVQLTNEQYAQLKSELEASGFLQQIRNRQPGDLVGLAS